MRLPLTKQSLLLVERAMFNTHFHGSKPLTSYAVETSNRPGSKECKKYASARSSTDILLVSGFGVVIWSIESSIRIKIEFLWNLNESLWWQDQISENCKKGLGFDQRRTLTNQTKSIKKRKGIIWDNEVQSIRMNQSNIKKKKIIKKSFRY